MPASDPDYCISHPTDSELGHSWQSYAEIPADVMTFAGLPALEKCEHCHKIREAP